MRNDKNTGSRVATALSPNEHIYVDKEIWVESTTCSKNTHRHIYAQAYICSQHIRWKWLDECWRAHAHTRFTANILSSKFISIWFAMLAFIVCLFVTVWAKIHSRIIYRWIGATAAASATVAQTAFLFDFHMISCSLVHHMRKFTIVKWLENEIYHHAHIHSTDCMRPYVYAEHSEKEKNTTFINWKKNPHMPL